MHEQRMTALEQANLVRLGRSAVRRGLENRELSLSDALTNPYTQKVRVADVVRWVPGYSQRRTIVALSKANISEYAYVEQITERQRAVLSEWVA